MTHEAPVVSLDRFARLSRDYYLDNFHQVIDGVRAPGFARLCPKRTYAARVRAALLTGRSVPVQTARTQGSFW
jgi:hypothetical protein